MNDAISFNTAIGLAFVAAVPALIIWAILSFRVWIAGGRVLRKNNYRLAVTYFLFSLTLVVLDQIRLRFHLRIFGIDGHDSTTWLVFAIRWNFTFAVWWGTLVLYGHYIPRLIHWGRRRGVAPQGERDPYLDDEKLAVITEQEVRVATLAQRLRSVADELTQIIARIERDDSVLPLNPRREKRKECA